MVLNCMIFKFEAQVLPLLREYEKFHKPAVFLFRTTLPYHSLNLLLKEWPLDCERIKGHYGTGSDGCLSHLVVEI